MLSAFLVLPHVRLSLSSPRLVEARPVQPPPLVRLACWLGNRPADRSGDWRPVALSGLPPAGFPHTRWRLRKKKQSRSRAYNPPAHGGHLFNWGLSSKAPKPPWIVYVPDASGTNPPTTHAYIQPENVGLSGGEKQLFINKQDVQL